MKEMDMIKDIVRAYRNYPDYVAFVIDDTSYTYQEVFARVQELCPSCRIARKTLSESSRKIALKRMPLF
ncbi:MAG: hypothetical protein ACLU4N_12275 [Butyricimonas faecihominis]